MIKSSILVIAAMMAVPAAAQMAAPSTYPMCSSKMQDGCQQPPKEEARAISGALAEKRGKHMDDGTGPTKGMGAMPMADAGAPMAEKMGSDHKMMHHRKMMHHHKMMMKKADDSMAPAADAMPPK